MANQWGRKETIIWPPHAPVMSYTALAAAFLCTCLFVWQRLHFSLPPLQQSYISEYIRSEIGAAVHTTALTGWCTLVATRPNLGSRFRWISCQAR